MKTNIAQKIAVSHEKLRRNQVWCTTCGRTQIVDGAKAMRHGWPECCNQTMTIDSPEERKALKRETK